MTLKEAILCVVHSPSGFRFFSGARHAARLTGGVGNYARVRSGDKHGFLPRNPALGGAVICTKRMMVYALPRRVKEEEEEEEEEEVLFLSEF